MSTKTKANFKQKKGIISSKSKSSAVKKIPKGAIGHGGKVKHRKIFRDNIHGISNPALLRMMQRAGVKRVNGFVYEELRDIMKTYMENIINATVIFVEHDRRVTVKAEDLEAGLDSQGISLIAGLNPNTKKTRSLQSCNSRSKSGPVKKSKVTGDGKVKAVKKPHRFRPGTRSLMAIRFQQRNSDCLAIPKANFQRLAREISQDYHEKLCFSAGVLDLFQLVVEDYIISLCRDAYLCTIHARRGTIQPKDIQLARTIRNDFF